MHPSNLLRVFLLTLFACSAYMLGGCGGDGAGTGTPSGNGTLAVRMSDAGSLTLTAATVTVTKIDAHVDNDWETIFTGNQTVNLFDLRNDDVLLGSALVKAGHYTQMRIFVKDATVTDGTGVHDVVIPSATQTGIKINLNFDVEPKNVTTILLDFNVAKSFLLQGNGQYKLKPVIPAVIKVLSGTATGIVENAGGPVEGASVTAVYTSGSEYPIGTEVNSTFTQANGKFKVWALLPGTYTFLFSYDNAGTTESATVASVDVTANANTNLGTVMLH